MDIAHQIKALLSSSSALTALVETRINPVTATPNGQMPNVVYALVGTETRTYLSGPATGERSTLIVEVQSKDRDEMYQIMAVVKNILHGYRGGSILHLVMDGQADQITDEGFNGVQNYTCFHNADASTASAITIYVGSDCPVSLLDLRDSLTGDPVDDATVTGTVGDYDFALDPTDDPGDYAGVIPAAVTATYTAGTTKTITVTAQDGNRTLVLTIRGRVTTP